MYTKMQQIHGYCYVHNVISVVVKNYFFNQPWMFLSGGITKVTISNRYAQTEII